MLFAKIRILYRVIRDYFRYSHEAELFGFAIGFNSFVNREKDLHILMLDYDMQDFDPVEQSVTELIDFWNLSDAYVYSTNKGYHVLFYFDIMPYSRVRMIISYARDVDPLYKMISKFYDHKTIRAAGKYKKHDIALYKVIRGIRTPTLKELELGELKKMEHDKLFSLHTMLNKEGLK